MSTMKLIVEKDEVNEFDNIVEKDEVNEYGTYNEIDC